MENQENKKGKEIKKIGKRAGRDQISPSLDSAHGLARQNPKGVRSSLPPDAHDPGPPVIISIGLGIPPPARLHRPPSDLASPAQTLASSPRHGLPI
jgi:hypothetical protein